MCIYTKSGRKYVSNIGIFICEDCTQSKKLTNLSLGRLGNNIGHV